MRNKDFPGNDSLPQSARERCERLAESSGKFFTSNLSVNEFLCAKNSNLKVLAEVMGTAFLSIPVSEKALKKFLVVSKSYNYRNGGFAANYGASTGGGYEPYVGELYDLSTGHRDVRYEALQRMKDEATILGATGIIGVKFESKVRQSGDYTLVEFTVIGTAVSLGQTSTGAPFTSLLSAQEFLQLWQGGFIPCGVVFGVCSYTDAQIMTASAAARTAEVGSFTNCVYEARRLASEDFVKEICKVSGAGAVGVTVDLSFQDTETEMDIGGEVESSFVHLITNIAIMGTAIRRRENYQRQPVQPLRILDLKDLKKRS